MKDFLRIDIVVITLQTKSLYNEDWMTTNGDLVVITLQTKSLYNNGEEMQKGNSVVITLQTKSLYNTIFVNAYLARACVCFRYLILQLFELLLD